MNLESLIKYQEEDMKLYVYEKQLMNSEEAKKIKQFTTEKTKYADELKAGARRLDELYAIIDKYSKDVEAMGNDVADLIEVMGSFEELREVDLYEKKLNAMIKKIESGERDIKSVSKAIEDINSGCKQAISRIMQCNDVLKKNKAAFEEKRAKMQSEVLGLLKSVKALEVSVDKELLEKYKALRNSKPPKMPAIVEVHGTACKGCGMNIDTAIMSKLEQDIVECPNCGRLVYKKK